MPVSVLGHSALPMNCIIDATKAIKAADPVKRKYMRFHFLRICEIKGSIKQTRMITQAGTTPNLGQPFPVLISVRTRLPAPKIPMINRRLMTQYVILFDLIYMFYMACKAL